jgi:hypothetical protein
MARPTGRTCDHGSLVSHRGGEPIGNTAATPDEDAEDKDPRIDRMRQSVAEIDDATVVFDGGFAGSCAWTESVCPGTTPKFGGDPVCEDGRPVNE